MKIAAICVAAAGLAIAAPAFAAGLTLNNSVMMQKRSLAPDGTTRVSMVPVQTATPGDRVTFQIAYHNGGKLPAEGVVLNNPLPSAVSYRGPAAGSPSPEVSVDGTHFGPLSTLTVRDASGISRAARQEDVTHVRWRITQPVPAGGSGRVGFDALIK